MYIPTIEFLITIIINIEYSQKRWLVGEIRLKYYRIRIRAA